MIANHQLVGHAEQAELLEQMRALFSDVDASGRKIFERWRPSIRVASSFRVVATLRRISLGRAQNGDKRWRETDRVGPFRAIAESAMLPKNGPR
jgi:hypothetical protein